MALVIDPLVPDATARLVISLKIMTVAAFLIGGAITLFRVLPI